MVAKNIMKEKLCKENITTRSQFRKWAIKNHPDKISKDVNSPERREVNERFKEFSDYVSELLPENSSSIDCPEKIPKQTPKKKSKSKSASPKLDSTNKDYMTVSESDDTNATDEKLPVNLKKAQCVRNVENWTKILKHHRFDKNTFQKKQTIDDMSVMSPKLVEMMKTIDKLDNEDMKKHGKYFKHFIFSDVKKGGYGAKIIASAMIASGYNHCFTKKLSIVKPESNDEQHTLGLLSSTALFDKPMTQKHVKSILNIYNKRPDNIYGEDMRFIIFDSGFKEGIDLFDVKYVHIFENQRTAADLTQAVGRATRSCGQKGLNFIPNVGWPLHVYQYYLTSTNDENAKIPFDDYLRYSGVNLNMHQFTENLEKLAIHTSVDNYLNKNINSYEKEVDEKFEKVLMLENDRVETSGGASLIGCKQSDKCGVRSTKTVPFPIKLLSSVYKKKLPSNFKSFKTKDKRDFFCQLLRSDPEYCKAVNEKFSKSKIPNNMIIKVNTQKEQTKSKSSNRSQKIKNDEQLVMFKNMKDDFEYENLEDMPFKKFQQYINKAFIKYKYEPIKITNLCDPSNSQNTNFDERIVEYTKSQEFVTNYFVPEQFTKGILVWHSVGTGKTCTAISVKSFLFERQDYTVIWVTRNTLKEDIWKNMYDKICDHIIREKYTGSEDAKQLKKHLSKRFLPPMSYRQFSNMLAGKNDLYRKLESLNGKEDILKNTLIIVDEAHKLYSNDLVPLEKPDMKLVEKKIDESPTCKVLLMTGTPITDDPMEFMKLMNLLMKKNKFPTTFNDFRKEFMSGNKFTQKGVKDFQNRTKGLISYLNRRYDPRQFAQPIFHMKPVEMSKSSFNMDKCVKDSQQKHDSCIDELNNTGFENAEKLNKMIAEMNTLRESLKNDKYELKNDKNNENLKSRIVRKKLDLDVLREDIKNQRKNLKNEKTIYNRQKSQCKKQLTNDKKQCKLEEKNVANYQNVSFDKC